MGSKKFRIIPRARIQEGIKLCRENISVFLDTAQSLMRTQNLNHAAINVEFAIEEYAKILILRDEYERNYDPVHAPNHAFKIHSKKSERAWKNNDPTALDPKFKMISAGGFERSDNGKVGFSRGFSQAINISHNIRCECAFVDYDENDNQWYLGHDEIDVERLGNLISHIRQKTAELASPS